MNLLMKQADFAARRGVGTSAVSNWKKRGLVVFAPDPERPGKQLIDVTKTELLLGGTIDPTRGRPRGADTQAATEIASAADAAPTSRRRPGEPPADPLNAARLAELTEKTIRRRIDNERLVGGLVSLAEYESRASDLGRLVRERTVGLVRTLAERLAAETDPRRITAILDEAFDGLFNQLADEIEAQTAAETAADAALAQVEADLELQEDEEEPEGT